MSTLTLHELLKVENLIPDEPFKPLCLRFKNKQDYKLFYYDLFMRYASPMHDYISYTCENNPDYAAIKSQLTQQDHMNAATSGFHWDYLMKSIEIERVPLESVTNNREPTIQLNNTRDFFVFLSILAAGTKMARCVMGNCYKNPELAEEALKAIQLWTTHNDAVARIIYGKNKTQSDEAMQSKNTEYGS